MVLSTHLFFEEFLGKLCPVESFSLKREKSRERKEENKSKNGRAREELREKSLCIEKLFKLAENWEIS